MYNIIAHSGLATTQLDMTAALAPLGIGLVSLLAVSAGMIVWLAVRALPRASVTEITVVALPPQEQKMAA